MDAAPRGLQPTLEAMQVAGLPLPVPEARLPDASARVGPFVDAVQHRALKLGQRVQSELCLRAAESCWGPGRRPPAVPPAGQPEEGGVWYH